MVGLSPFRSLDQPHYEKNAGRIADVKKLNGAINAITREHTSEELIELLRAITVPVSKIKTDPRRHCGPLVNRRLLWSQDPVSGARITLAPPPNMTPFLERSKRELSFPPRFGQHNQEIYSGVLGCRRMIYRN